MNATEPINIRGKIARCNKKKTPEERQECIDQIIVESIETLDQRAGETGNDTKLILATMSAFQNNFRDALQNVRDEMRNTRESMTIDINRLENKVDERFNMVGTEMSQIKSWVGTVFERVNAMDPKIATMGEKTDAMEKTVDQYFSK